MNRVIWDEIISFAPMAENGILGILLCSKTTTPQQHIIQWPISKKDGSTFCGAIGKGSTPTLVTLSWWRRRPKSWVRIRAMHLRDEPLVASCLTHKD